MFKLMLFTCPVKLEVYFRPLCSYISLYEHRTLSLCTFILPINFL